MKKAANIFSPGGEAEKLSSISLSVYSKPEVISKPRSAVYDRFNMFLGMQADLD